MQSSTTLLDAVQWQCNTILNEQKPIQNNPSPSIEGLGPLPIVSRADEESPSPDMSSISSLTSSPVSIKAITGAIQDVLLGRSFFR